MLREFVYANKKKKSNCENTKNLKRLDRRLFGVIFWENIIALFAIWNMWDEKNGWDDKKKWYENVFVMQSKKILTNKTLSEHTHACLRSHLQ